MTHEANHHALEALVDMLVGWYCGRSLHLLLTHVDVHELSEEQLVDLERFDFHYFAAIPNRSITFIRGKQAVEIIRGIRDGRWSKDQVLTAIGAAA